MNPINIHIQLSGTASSPLQLLSLQGQEAISELFSYTIIVRSEKSLSAAELLFQPICLNIQFENDITEYLHAIITQVKPMNAQDYQLGLSPHFICMQDELHTRTFKNKNVLEIFLTLCKNYSGLQSDLSKITTPSFETSFQFQYAETDWDFLRRLFLNHALFFYFDQKKENSVLVLGNETEAYPAQELKPLLMNTTLRESIFPDTKLTHVVLQAQSNDPIHAGNKLNFDERTWVVHKVKYAFSAAPGQYFNEILATPLHSPSQQKIIRRMPGPLLAKVTNTLASKIQVRFYVEQTENILDSDWIPIMQTTNGTTQSMQFIPRKDDIVLVHFAEGNANNPIAIDAIPRTSTFVLPQEKNILGWRTKTVDIAASGFHEISFDSTEQQEKINIQSQGDSFITADKNMIEKISKNKITTIQTGDQNWSITENAVFSCDKKITLKCAESMIEMDADKITITSQKISNR